MRRISEAWNTNIASREKPKATYAEGRALRAVDAAILECNKSLARSQEETDAWNHVFSCFKEGLYAPILDHQIAKAQRKSVEGQEQRVNAEQKVTRAKDLLRMAAAARRRRNEWIEKHTTQTPPAASEDMDEARGAAADEDVMDDVKEEKSEEVKREDDDVKQEDEGDEED